MKQIYFGNAMFSVFRSAVAVFQNKWVGRAIFAGLILMAIASVALVAAWGFRDHYKIVWNLSESLPQHLFVIEMGVKPQKGDLVAFKWVKDDSTPMNPYPYGTTFVKILEGVPGDVVVENKREFSIDGKSLGFAKQLSKKGQALQLGHVGVIPPGSFYVRGTHRDSLDSRYDLLGLVREKDVLGRAFAVF
jgi:conjugal transfer pilin signal peptidase TrbI